ncbi:MAG: TfoX/Sxy family protein [Saprospiraceae bacterium]|nr:TfoX/Sxy family protein [Lewinella sp.]
METDVYQLDRLRQKLSNEKVGWEEIKMFGGVCFMVDDKMCFGARKDGGLMVRVDPEDMDSFLEMDGVSRMIHGERVMKAFLFLTPEAIDSESELDFWIRKCLDYNPRAKASKKRKKS